MSEIAADWLGKIQPYVAHYGCGFVLVVLFLENVLFLGTIIPGAVVLVVAGYAAGAGSPAGGGAGCRRASRAG